VLVCCDVMIQLEELETYSLYIVSAAVPCMVPSSLLQIKDSVNPDSMASEDALVIINVQDRL
jgi:hypothetical protein